MAEANVNSSPIPNTNSNLCKAGYLIIIAGQSNGCCYFNQTGNISAGLQGIQTDLYTYFKAGADFPNTDSGNWVQLRAGVNDQTGTPQTGYFSVGLIIGNRLKTNYGKTAYLIPTGIPNSWLDVNQTNSWNVNKANSNSYYYNAIQNTFRMAYSGVNGVNLTPVLLWIQGEGDSSNGAAGTAYQQNQVDLINKFRLDTGFPNMKTIITQIRSDYAGDGAEPGLTAVRAAKVYAAANMSDVTLYNTDTARTPLSADLTHYNPRVNSWGGVMSIVNMGEDLADIISTF